MAVRGERETTGWPGGDVCRWMEGGKAIEVVVATRAAGPSESDRRRRVGDDGREDGAGHEDEEIMLD
jgi:hypothetical protein